MEREQQIELAALREAAIKQLQTGEWFLRLGAFPSFGERQVLGVVHSHQQYEIIHRVWNFASDCEKLRTPTERLRHPRTLAPTILEQRVRSAPEPILRICATLEKLTFPVAPANHVVGLDGTSFDVLVCNGEHSACFRWWEGHPVQWHPLMNWFETTWGTLADILARTREKPPPELPRTRQ